MPYIYENDPTKIGTNLQTAVAYLLSLHKDQYEWNLLGIKVIGVKEELPIPDGTYDYGDAYMIGNETDGYEMWIYTRADEAHAEAYWFNVGAFPKPGPQGPKGDGLEQIYKWQNGYVTNVTYDTTEGAKILQTTTVDYTDSTDGFTKQQQFGTTTTLPIVPGKYMSMDATSDNKKMEVKIDDTALALDYIKLDKATNSVIPEFYNGKIQWDTLTSTPAKGSVVQRDTNGDSSFHRVNAEYLGYMPNGDSLDFYTIFANTQGSDYTIDKTPTDTGTLTATQIAILTAQYQAKNLRIIYDNQVYIRMDPLSHPDGTMNYIHLDSVQNGSGGYKAIVKCFSVTVSTRAWQVVDLNFSGQTTHNLLITDNVSGNGYYFQLATTQSAAYTTADVRTIMAEVKDKIIPCVFRKGIDSDKKFYSGILQATDTAFSCSYGEQNMDFGMTPTQVTVRDKV